MSDTKSVNNLESQDSVKPVILVADDEDTIRSCLKEALEAEGHKEYTSEDGGNSLRLTKELIPGLVILDLKMTRSGINSFVNLKEFPPSTDVYTLCPSASNASFKQDLIVSSSSTTKITGFTLSLLSKLLTDFVRSE